MMRKLILSTSIILAACGESHLELQSTTSPDRLGSMVLASASADPQASSNSLANYPNDTLQKALRRASLVLVGRIPSTEEQTQLSKVGPLTYESLISGYLESSAFQQRLHNFHLKVFEMGGLSDGINFNEAANLADFLVINKLNQKEILTANYCINDQLEKISCSAFSSNEQQLAQAAGVLTTQGFLVQWNGPFYFKRTKKMQEIFTCQSFPLSSDPGLSEEEISSTLKPFNSLTETPQCYSCHRTMNPRAAMFFSFDRNGKFNLNPTESVAPLTDTSETANLGMLLTAKAETRAYERPIGNLKDLAHTISQTRDFRDCLVQRYGNFILGQDSQAQLPVDLHYLKERLDLHQFQIQPLIIDILTSDRFITGE